MLEYIHPHLGKEVFMLKAILNLPALLLQGRNTGTKAV